MKKYSWIIVTFSLFIVSGVFLGQGSIGSLTNQNHEIDHGHLVTDDNGSIEEEVYGVQLVIKGKVEQLGDSFKRKSGLITRFGEELYDVTPATIDVQKVVYGTSPDSSKITLLQHGRKEDNASSVHFVTPGEEVILLLVKTTDGYYWSYNFELVHGGEGSCCTAFKMSKSD
ncbi:hypothetical protein GE107_08725 [Cohnella sp. CFH 77786]|uniref:hypothetical protein n=1 Tax=Cohnella sp. CFH 77786 TaxID=2662265 RepID=UPI001C60C800|nr:hypothetical protein [Cohnella sp. CFH 77786]MBW5446143.1 hypothetical protein [Cohnella sp. CFH 77786]